MSGRKRDLCHLDRRGETSSHEGQGTGAAVSSLESRGRAHGGKVSGVAGEQACGDVVWTGRASCRRVGAGLAGAWAASGSKDWRGVRRDPGAAVRVGSAVCLGQGPAVDSRKLETCPGLLAS